MQYLTLGYGTVFYEFLKCGLYNTYNTCIILLFDTVNKCELYSLLVGASFGLLAGRRYEAQVKLPNGASALQAGYGFGDEQLPLRRSMSSFCKLPSLLWTRPGHKVREIRPTLRPSSDP
jgi:hypothetical protein